MIKNVKKISKFELELLSSFEVKDIKNFYRCLGMDFIRKENGIIINQRITEIF